ncbi:hypothetical protein Tco_1144960 [Tanacetum coccineum]
MFSIRIHHGRRFHKFSGRRYVDDEVDIFDMVDIEVFFVGELYEMVLQLSYKGESEPLFYNCLRPMSTLDERLYSLACDENAPPQGVRATIEDINEPITVRCKQTINHVLDDVIRHISFDDMELDGEVGFGDVASSSLDSSGLIHNESFGVDGLDLNLNLMLGLNVPQKETQEEVLVYEVPNDHVVNESYTHVDIESEVDVCRIEEHIVLDVRVDEVVHGGGEESVEQGHGEEFVEHDSGQQVQYNVDDEDVLMDVENEIVEPNVDVHLFGITKDFPFNNIGVTSLPPDEVLEGDGVDVVNMDAFNSDTSCEDQAGYHGRKRLNELRRDMEDRVLNDTAGWKYSYYCGQKFGSAKEAIDMVCLHSTESKRNLKFFKNDKTRDLCPWVLYVAKDELKDNWEYAMLRDYVVDLQSTTVKIVIEKNIDPS